MVAPARAATPVPEPPAAPRGETSLVALASIVVLRADAPNVIAIRNARIVTAAGPAIDAGTILPGVTDGFTGRAPDLGALESGRVVPSYGPRPLSDQR